MATTLRKAVTVQPGGVVQLQADELREGTEAEVVVIARSDSDSSSLSWQEFIGSGADSGRSLEEIDRSIRELRDEWPQ